MTIRQSLKLLTGVLACWVASLSAFASNSGQVPNNIPPWLTEATLVGPSDGSKQVAIAIHLQLNNASGLQAFLHDLYTRGTASYGHYLTPEEFRAAYSPAASAVAAVQSFLSHGGLKLEYTPANGFYVEASGSIAQVAKLFAVTQKQFQYEGIELRANSEAPSVPASLGSIVSFIEGLDESEALIQPAAAPGTGGYHFTPCSTYWGDHSATVSPPAYQYGSSLPYTVCGYTPQQIRAAYHVDRVQWTGAGVRVGVVDAFASPTIVDDVNRYSAHYGLPPLTSSNFQQVVVPGTLNFPAKNKAGPQSWYGEETLDIEAVHSVAPDAIIIFAGAQNTNGPLDHALIYLIDNHLADVISNSWSYYFDPKLYGYVQADERIFMQAAAEGISVSFAAGDYGNDLVFDPVAVTVAQGNYPATSPFATGMGATTLAIYDAAGDKNEWGWGTYISQLLNSAVSGDGTQVGGTGWSVWPPSFYTGSSGGISLTFLQPDYQQGVVPTSLATSTVDSSGNLVTFPSPHRVTPDIAMDGDVFSPFLIGKTFAISGDPSVDAGCTTLSKSTEYCERPFGNGTSLATPLFSGVLALTNQARFALGKSPVGFVNPTLYRLRVGKLGSDAPIYDVLPPQSPMGTILNYETSSGAVTYFGSVNSVSIGTNGPVIEGADTSLRTTPGYDNVTGLGVPNVPAFISAFTSLP